MGQRCCRSPRAAWRPFGTSHSKSVVAGSASCLSCNTMAIGGGWTPLGGCKASASAGCQTHHERLCQGTAMEERGTALVGLLFCLPTWGGFCFTNPGSFSALAPAFALWMHSLHLTRCVTACLAPSFLRGFLRAGWFYMETRCLFLLFC